MNRLPVLRHPAPSRDMHSTNYIILYVDIIYLSHIIIIAVDSGAWLSARLHLAVDRHGDLW